MLRALVAVGFLAFGASAAIAGDSLALPFAFAALALVAALIASSHLATWLHPQGPWFVGAVSDRGSRLISQEPAGTLARLVLLEQPRR